MEHGPFLGDLPIQREIFHSYVELQEGIWWVYLRIGNIFISPKMDPSTFLGSVWAMILGVKCLLRRCLDP